MMTQTIAVTERSTLILDRRTFERLQQSRHVDELLEKGVISFVRSRDAPYGIRASCYVGQALLDDVRLIVREKSEGAVHALLHWALPDDYRDAKAPSPIGRDSPVLEMFARRLVSHLGYYLRHGRLKEYRKRLEVGASPKGRVDPGETARLRSKGRTAVVAYRTSQLTADNLPNQLLAQGLRAVEEYFSSHDPARDSVALARTYAPLFEDINRGKRTQIDPSWIGPAFETVLRDPRVAGDLLNSLQYARSLLLHLGAWPAGPVEAELPASYFLNLETLFEDAVRQVLSEVTRPIPVIKGASLKRGLFSSLRDRYIADPDLVVGDASAPALVGDCKYKELNPGEYPEHGDVYQLAAHSAAMRSPLGLLIYPGDVYALSPLGATESGVQIIWCTVRIRQLAEDLLRVATSLPLKPSD